MHQYPKLIIGCQEWIKLPELNIPAIRAKVDTGAKTSSLHAYRIEQFEENNQHYVRFELHPVRKNRKIKRQCVMPVFDKRIVKSSSGTKEKRPVIRTTIHIDGEEWEIDLNLTNRDYMGFRMLIGREAMEKNILVHPGIKYIHGKMTDEESKMLY